jgi:F0F1-type ATP synthase membrane subunit b/b'
LSREAKVNLALDMSSTVAALILDSIRDRYPRISEARLLELARSRFRSRTTSQQHVEDIRAILANTRVNKRRILAQARKEGTVNIFREILQSTQTRKNRNQTVEPDKKKAKRLKTGGF